MNKKQQQHENIINHGLKLNRIFNLNRIDPMTICKQVHRIEVKAHRLAEDYCNIQVDKDKHEKAMEGCLKALDRVLNFNAQGIPVFINRDPRGYALKIESEYVAAHNLDIHRDWGGYGIIAPEF